VVNIDAVDNFGLTELSDFSLVLSVQASRVFENHNLFQAKIIVLLF